jgi:transposase
MNANVSNRPHDWREGRRFRAVELAQQGWTQRAIAAALGVSHGAVGQWLSRAKQGGVEALRRHPAPGPQPKLTSEERAQLPALLARGAEAYGFRGDLWTTKRVAAVIEREYSVRYHPAHVSRLLRALRWTSQKPVKRATQRDEAAVAQWYAERWPAIQKRGRSKAVPSSG